MSSLENIISFFKRQSPGWIFAQALALVGGIGFVDYLTGYELAIFPFYSVPILLAEWFGNKYSAAVISIFSAIAWWGADVASGHVYTHEWHRGWDIVVRLMFFGLVMFAGTAVRQQRDAARTRFALIERTQRLERDIIDISERERRRIGRDLHDSICQYLAAISFTAGRLKRELERESFAGAKTAGDIEDFLQDALTKTRDLSRGLSPVDRDERGLESALNDLASTTSRLMEILCIFRCPEPVRVRDNDVSVHLFRIAQEALSNATKHGHARSVVIALEESGENLTLSVSDDGTGFDPQQTEQGGIGLSIMAYRARTVGGKLQVESKSPTGTIVSCTIDNHTNAAPTPD
jgi:signal transduction histidine kinase